MNQERWRQIETLYHAALECEPDARLAFLENACGGDEDLRREVESLLAQERTATALLSQPLDKVAAGLLDGPFASGAMVGPYRINGQIGAGGMGEVYRAQDTRLQRTVAIKTVNASFTNRFQHEARAISALNHPHICTLYDVGSQEGVGYLVMEYVEGDPLKGPLPIADALRLAIQIASALEAAHEKGILHRDLKPGNILVAKSGVKLLDFGLAKIATSAPCAKEVTITASLTGTGQVLGTPAYMSPEQIEGKPADARSDIFSFGLVLYEILAGRRAFDSASQNGLMAAILKEEPPPLTSLQPSTPAALDRTVRKCLAKDPAQRWQTATDLLHELEWIAAGDSASPRTVARRVSFRWVALAAGVMFFVAGYLYIHRTPELTDKDTIVLADFKNTTGDPVFDGTLRQGLAIQLEQSPFLRLVSEERIQRTLSLMGLPADAPLTPEVAREICERTASAAVLGGSIDRLGSQYVVGLRAQNCRSRDVVDEEQGQAARKEDVLNALSQIASKFRVRVGESLTTVKRHDTSLAEATTQSLEALKAYSAATKVLWSTGSAAALPLFGRAIEIDPKFAMAHAFLGRMYGDIGETVRSAESTSTAYQLRNRTSDAEKFFITSEYDLQVTGNLERAQQTFELWAQTYPRELSPPGLLSGVIYPTFGKFEKAIEQAKKGIALDPDFPFAYINLAYNNLFLGRFEEAASALQRASERKVGVPELLLARYDFAFIKGDKAGMEAVAALAQGTSGIEGWISDHAACVLAYSGRLQQATKMARRAADLAQHALQPESSVLYQTGAAVWEAFFGNAAEAKRDALKVLDLSKGRDVLYGAAFALALSGDFSRTRALAKDLETRFPEDTSVRFSYLPTLRALFAVNDGQASEAIDLLQVAVPYEGGTPGSSFNGNFGNLYPVYVRGQAYLAAHHGPEAATEFQKVLAHPGIMVSDPMGAVARLQLGRAFVLSGEKTKAKSAYQDFLTLWKDADQDIPIFKQAKAEYANLH